MNALAKLDPNALVRTRVDPTTLVVHPAQHPDRLVRIARFTSSITGATDRSEKIEYLYAVGQLSYQLHGPNAARTEKHIMSFGSMREAVTCAEFIFSRWTDAREEDFNVLRRDPLRPIAELKGSPRSRAWLSRGWDRSVCAEGCQWISDGSMAIRSTFLPERVEALLRSPRAGYEPVTAARLLSVVEPYLDIGSIDPAPSVLGFGYTFTTPVGHVRLGAMMQYVDARKLALLLTVLAERVTLRFADGVLDPLMFHVDGHLAAVLMPIRIERMGPDVYTASENVMVTT
jgi:hypothetical protein